MTALSFLFSPASKIAPAVQGPNPGTMTDLSAPIDKTVSVDPGTVSDVLAQSGQAAGRAASQVAGRVAAAASSDVMEAQPRFPLLAVLLVLALLALALAAAYIVSLRRQVNQMAFPGVVPDKTNKTDTAGGTDEQVRAPAKRRAGSIRSVRVGKLHELGRRQYQQDAFGVSHEALLKDHGVLAILADGMGGLADSERVSVTAVETILDRFSLAQGWSDPRVLLLQLVADARQEVNKVLGAADLGRSGSTLVMGLIDRGMLYYLAVGDSRIYLLRDGALLQLTREHIYENELALLAVNGGHCEVQDAFTNPQRGALTSFLGMERLMAIDIPAAPVRLRPGDKVILMTDGVFNALEEEELTAWLLLEPEKAAEGLRAAIEERGYTNQDNYTAVILECREEEPQQEDATVPTTLIPE